MDLTRLSECRQPLFASIGFWGDADQDDNDKRVVTSFRLWSARVSPRSVLGSKFLLQTAFGILNAASDASSSCLRMNRGLKITITAFTLGYSMRYYSSFSW